MSLLLRVCKKWYMLRGKCCGCTRTTTSKLIRLTVQRCLFVLMVECSIGWIPVHVITACTVCRINVSGYFWSVIQCLLEWQNTKKNHSEYYLTSHCIYVIGWTKVYVLLKLTQRCCVSCLLKPNFNIRSDSSLCCVIPANIVLPTKNKSGFSIIYSISSNWHCLLQKMFGEQCPSEHIRLQPRPTFICVCRT